MLHSHGLPEDRKLRIVERLHELDFVTIADMQQLQYDLWRAEQNRDSLRVDKLIAA